MIPRRAARVALLVLLLQHGSLHAHHAFSPVYDGSKTVTITGTLTDFKLVNPHAMMTIDVVEKAGKRVVWTVEMPGLLSLTRLGWTEKTVAVGDRLTVSGNPTHTGSARVAFKKIVLANGTELLDPNEDRSSTVEEQRRERARQRQQK
ncbi:MAG: hypothetical protein HOP16_03355 [Acidobacteria bacterium]|nr:hypothetical protein [Acidobacteriota bacterium]